MSALLICSKASANRIPKLQSSPSTGLGAFDQISRAAMLDGLLKRDTLWRRSAVRAHVLRSSFLLSVGGQCRDGAHDPHSRRGHFGDAFGTRGIRAKPFGQEVGQTWSVG